MNTLLVIALAVGVVSADIGIGYKYRVPQTSYGVPSYQISGGSGHYNPGSLGLSGDAHHYRAQNAHSGEYQGFNFGQQNSGYQSGVQAVKSGAAYQPSYVSSDGVGGRYYQTIASSNTFSSNGASVSQPSYQFSGSSAQSGQQNFNQYQTSNQYQSSAAQKYKEYYNQQQNQPAQVFKHFYVHAAPEEPEPPKYRQPIPLPPPQKHYKIIFIKTPSPPAYAPQLIPVQQQNEEKTIVYVLVKKPEEQEDIILPKVEPTPPSRPEVFFIKYDNKDDSQHVINNIVSEYKGEGFSNAGVSSGSSGTSASTGEYIDFSAFGQNSQVDSSGQYTQTGSSGQYTQTGGSLFGASASGQNVPTVVSGSSTAQNTQFGANGSGQNSQNVISESSSGQNTQTVVSTSGSNQNTQSSSSGLLTETGSSQNTENTGSGQLSQFTEFFGSQPSSQTVSESSAGSFGTSSGSTGNQALSLATADSASLSGGSSSFASSTASSISYENVNAISTSQGIPHETYGPPKFRV